MQNDPHAASAGLASYADIKSILGALDEATLLEVTALRPTIRDVEQAAVWLSGDRDIFGADEPMKGTVAEIVAVLTAGDEEEESSPR